VGNPWTWRNTCLVVGLPLAPVALVFLFLAGRDLGEPTPVTPERAAIIGVWANADGATLDFRANGTVTAGRMPTVVDPGLGVDDLPGNGVGTWAIEPWESASGSGGGVEVTIGDADAQMTTTGDPAHPDLYISIGDPDDGNDFTFTRRAG
jgi:hypothetical protein